MFDQRLKRPKSKDAPREILRSVLVSMKIGAILQIQLNTFAFQCVCVPSILRVKVLQVCAQPKVAYLSFQARARAISGFLWEEEGDSMGRHPTLMIQV